MIRLIEKSRYIALIAIFSILLAATGAFLWGAYKTYLAISLMVTSQGSDPLITFYLIQLVDVFLIAIVLFLLSASIFELFIGDLHLPNWMLAHNIDELKSKLSSLLILVMAVKFFEQLLEWKNPREVLLYAVAVSLVSGMLIAFNRFVAKD